MAEPNELERRLEVAEKAARNAIDTENAEVRRLKAENGDLRNQIRMLEQVVVVLKTRLLGESELTVEEIDKYIQSNCGFGVSQRPVDIMESVEPKIEPETDPEKKPYLDLHPNTAYFLGVAEDGGISD